LVQSGPDRDPSTLGEHSTNILGEGAMLMAGIVEAY
jgi:hypothetical protein